ncbi:MAG: hypothetical protein ACE5GW_03790 [Planctomycetota bacterium]
MWRQATRLIPMVLLVVLSGTGVRAQGSADREELERRYQKKCSAEFLKKVPWERSIRDAMMRARERNLPIIGYFTRSYAP